MSATTSSKFACMTARAINTMPGGVSHEARQLDPYALFIERADGAKKLGSDGRWYIDFGCGNGALIHGHGHKPSIEAAQRAATNGFHFSAGSEVELRWAEMVRMLMPAVEQVRFTSSGNEACLLAFAVAQAVTRRSAILTISDHYHGWAAPAVLPHVTLEEFEVARSNGEITLVEAPDVRSAINALAHAQFAAIIVEPTGASFGKVPLNPSHLRALREAAAESETLCVFDETITGFRVSPGGAQQLRQITPDLIVLGKILGGGLPCGALAGKRHHLSVLDPRRATDSNAGYVPHMGTGNGNPLVASVGYETLAALADGAALAKANAACARMRAGLNLIFDDQQIAWAAYGESSGFHIFLNPHGRDIDSLNFSPDDVSATELTARNPELVNVLRIALLEERIDINPWPGGLLSAAHCFDIIDEALDGFRSALIRLQSDGIALSGWMPDGAGSSLRPAAVP